MHVENASVNLDDEDFENTWMSLVMFQVQNLKSPSILMISWHGVPLLSRILKKLSLGLIVEVFGGNECVISMYSRWGHLVEARRVFEEMKTRDLVSWNAMISGYSQEGIYGLEAISMFFKCSGGMELDRIHLLVQFRCGYERNLELARQIMMGFNPNDVTFVGLIMPITIGELVVQGKMVQVLYKDGFSSNQMFVNSIITMYAKFKSMQDSVKMFQELKYQDIIAWHALTFWGTGNVDMGERVADALMEMEPNRVRPMFDVQLYAEIGKWEMVAKSKEKDESEWVKKEVDLAG
ncbi:hypothetical protein NC652_038871 [Populus alba x Populus x berolinensis]|nr:hypothetical protein NC652_038871 [Populus alba x Populus x berolinensis]